MCVLSEPPLWNKIKNSFEKKHLSRITGLAFCTLLGPRLYTFSTFFLYLLVTFYQLNFELLPGQLPQTIVLSTKSANFYMCLVTNINFEFIKPPLVWKSNIWFHPLLHKSCLLYICLSWIEVEPCHISHNPETWADHPVSNIWKYFSRLPPSWQDWQLTTRIS